MNFTRGLPIAMVDKNNIIFMDADRPPDKKYSSTSSDDFSSEEEQLNLVDIISSINRGQKICPLCDKELSCKKSLQRHIGIACPIAKAKLMINAGTRTKRILKHQKNKRNGGRTRGKLKLITNKFGKSEFKTRDPLKLIPPKIGRDTIFISGRSGSGKSTFVCNYIKQIRKKFPGKKIILFSFVEDDSAFNRFKKDKNFIRMQLDDSFVENPVNVNELAGCVTIFDDIMSSKSKDISDALNDLRDDILLKGRDHTDSGNDISCLSTTHLIKNWKETRNLLNESNKIVFFPSGPSQNIRNFMKDQGLDKKIIEKIMTLGSRWVCISNSFPMHIIHEKGAFML